MTHATTIREALCRFFECATLEDGRVAVPTLCLYPSNATVTVYVSGGPRECVISDDGGAVAQIAAHGIPIDDPDKMVRQFAVGSGLRHERGAIYSPPVPGDALVPVIMLVANASAQAAHWAVSHLRVARRRDLRAVVREIVEKRFGRERVKHEIPILGKSERLYRFDTVVDIGGGRRFIADTVVPEASSINARVVSHMDVRERGDPALVQRIVFDPADSWRSEELNLLQMAATLVAVDALDKSLDRIAHERSKV